MAAIDSEHQIRPVRGMVVVVTGAASGIGAATARLLHQAGGLPVLADRVEGALDDASRSLGGALAVRTDVTSQADVDNLVAASLERYGRIDGLVSSAGLSLHQPVASVDLDELDRVWRINVTGLLRVMQAVLPPMRAAGFGRIVNVSSGTTKILPLGAGPYAATKSAVNMLSRVARAELEGTGIAVSTVLPSITATRFGGGRYKLGEESWPGMVTHSPDFPARAIVRALSTGEESIDLPHGAEQPELYAMPGL